MRAAALAAVLVAARGPPQQDADEADQREADQGRGEEEQAWTEQHQRGDREHGGAGDRRGAARALGRLAGHRVGRDEHPARDVGEQAGAAGQREHDEPDAEDDRVDVEVAAEPAGHAAEHLVGGGAGEAPRLRARGRDRLGGSGGLRVGLRVGLRLRLLGPGPSGSPEVIGSSGFVGLIGLVGCVWHVRSPVYGEGGRSAGCRTSASAPIGNVP